MNQQKPLTPTISVIPPDLSAYLSTPASIVVAGQSALGKSSSVAEVASNCLWVVSSSKVLRAFASRIASAQKQVTDLTAAKQPLPSEVARWAKLKFPKKVIEIKEFVPGPNGDEVRNPNSPAIKAVLFEYLKALRADPNAFSGIVFDEWSRFAQRLQEEYKVEAGGDIWAANRKLHAMHRYLAKALPESSQKSLVLITEWREPEFFPNGALKAPGGPALPTMNMTKPLVYEMDFVFEFAIKEVKDLGRDEMDGGGPTTKIMHYWSTEVHPHYARKSRDARIPTIATCGFDELLANAQVYL